MRDPIFILIDLFCGFGGTTQGYELAELDGSSIALVFACVNHDPKAIKSHWLNHPDVKHYEEDIRTLDLTSLVALTRRTRARYPNAKLVLWASMECTNFSKAKGGLPRNADSRTLADHIPRYLDALDVDYFKYENVVEFMSWGPLMSRVVKDSDGYQSCPVSFSPIYETIRDSDAKPDWERVNGLLIDKNELGRRAHTGWRVIWQGVPESKKSGSDWLRWISEIESRGFRHEWRELNSANFGAYTSRNRLFGIFAKDHLPIAWPEPTHAKNPSMGMHGGLKKWMPVKEVLNFEDEGESILDRKTPLVEATLERIYAGLIKFVAKGDTSFLSKYFSGQPSGMNASTEGPAGVVTTKDHHGLVQASFLSKYYSGDPATMISSTEEPASTLRTKDSHALIQPAFIVQRNSGDPRAKIVDIEGPARTLTATAGNQLLVSSEFLQIHNGKSKVRSVDEPCPTIATNDRFGLVQPEHFIDKHFGLKSQNSSIDDPAGTILTNDKHRLVTAEPFIMPTNYDNKPKSINEPAPTITANRKHHYLVNHIWGGNVSGVEVPGPTIIARQDKTPLYLIGVQEGPVSVAVYDTDSPVMIRIKQFMAVFGIVDIKMRMLRVVELLKIQGFPADYKMVGNQADHKKFIGNSVHPLIPKYWSEAMAEKLSECDQEVA